MYTCDKCGKRTEEYLESVYGVQMCEDCWDEYLFTDEGKAEVIYSIYKGDCNPFDFDADYLGEAMTQWRKYKSEMDLSEDEIRRVDEYLGILEL